MTIELPALAVRASFFTTIAAVFVAALVLASPAHAASGSATPLLAQGAGMGAKPSARVHQLQLALERRGYTLGAPGVDGRFGPLTAAAVRRLQANRGLAVDGVVGQRTRATLGLTRRRTAAVQRPSSPPAVTATPAPASTPAAPSATPSTTPAAPAATPSTTPAAPAAAPSAAPAKTVTVIGSDNRSGDSAARMLFWAVLGAFAALVLIALWRRASRSRRARALRTAPLVPHDAALMSAPYEAGLMSAPDEAGQRSVPHDAGPMSTPHDAAPHDAGPMSAPHDAGLLPAPDNAAPMPAPQDVAPVPTNGTANGMPPSRPMKRELVMGYLTTSTEEWSDEHERASAGIEAMCDGRAWSLLEIVWDRESSATLDRPGLNYALERIAKGEARGLVVSDLQRLTRSPQDLGALMAWFDDAGATLVAIDLDLDTSTPGGRQVANTLIALGAAAPPRTADHIQNGGTEVRINGRPAVKDRPELLDRITAMRSANLTLQQIADQLNVERVPTLRGGSHWRPSSIQAALGYRRPGPRDRLPPLQNRGG